MQVGSQTNQMDEKNLVLFMVSSTAISLSPQSTKGRVTRELVDDVFQLVVSPILNATACCMLEDFGRMLGVTSSVGDNID